MTALLRLTATELRLFGREPMEWGFSLVLPPLLLVILGLVPAFGEPQDGLGGRRVIDLYAPIIVAVGVTALALLTLPQRFATYREKRILRRMRVTPVGPARMLGAQLLLCLLLSAATTTVVLMVALLAFGVPLPLHAPAYLLAYLLCVAAMLSLGLLVASLAPTGTAAGAIGTVLFFPLLFLGGLWITRQSMDGMLLTISDFSPLGASVAALQDATAGSGLQPLHVLVLLGWTAVCGGLAARFFRWE
ncbi:ABC transporter permease [Agromyces sp. LHK192]|uniref:ABC transporter permease n=1 Tax=Agromyces sp. LHK192 TaxID=2498704 RepID=UPI000FD7DFFC|nr:ABC transporter permease [Agromyces sp. LHK192]